MKIGTEPKATEYASLECNKLATTWLAKKEIAKDAGGGTPGPAGDRALAQVADA